MSIVRGTAANIAGALVPTAVSLVTVPLYLGAIGQERYGILVLIWLLLGYFGLFDLGLGRATAQRIAACAADGDEARARVLWTALALNGGFGIAGALVLWPVGELALGRWVSLASALRAEALGAVPWLAAAVPLMTVSGVLSGALQGRERFVILNVVHSAGAILSQVVPLAASVAWKPDLRVLVPAVLATRAVTSVALLAFCRRYVPLRGAPAIDRTLLRPLLGFGGWVTVTSLVGPLLTTLDRLIIGALAGARAVTHYSVPFNLASRITVLPGSLSSVLFPRFAAETVAEGDALLDRSVRALAAALTPLILLGMLAMRPFLAWWVGDDFSGDAAAVGEIIALGLWVNGLAHIPYALLQARGRPDLVARCHVAELLPYLAVLWAGLHFWGVVGAAAAWSLRVAANAVLLFWLARVRPAQLRALGPSALLLSAMALILSGSDSGSYWRWTLGPVFLVFGAAWSWRSGWFAVRRLARVPVAAGL